MILGAAVKYFSPSLFLDGHDKRPAGARTAVARRRTSAIGSAAWKIPARIPEHDQQHPVEWQGRFIAQEIVGDDRDIRQVAATFAAILRARHAPSIAVTSAPDLAEMTCDGATPQPSSIAPGRRA